MTRHFLWICCLLALLAFALAGCAPAATYAPMGADTSVESAEMPAAEPQVVAERGLAYNRVADSTAQFAPRLVIRNANLSLVVLDPGDSLNSIVRMAEEMDGFVVSSNLYKTTTNEGVEIPQAEITIRVPAEKLNEALDTIKALVQDPSVDILTENISGQDVTQEYTDTKSRLANLEAAEKQLQNIMDAAVKTEDVLTVYNQLVQIREQIEVLKGQIQYYEQAAALSAINISLRAQASVQPVVIGGWRPVGVARSAVQALINTLQFLGSALIWIVILVLPIGLILALLVLLLRFIARKLFKSKRRPAPVPPVDPAQQS